MEQRQDRGESSRAAFQTEVAPLTDLFPGFESTPTRKRAPRRKPKTAYPEGGFTREEKHKILKFCRRKAPQYLPVDKPGGLRDLMARMEIYYCGEGAHVWRRDWVLTAYNWILEQVKIDFRNAQRVRGPVSTELPQMERARRAEGVVRKASSLGVILDAIGSKPNE